MRCEGHVNLKVYNGQMSQVDILPTTEVGKEKGGGHAVRASEGQQRGQGPRPCSREGARRG